MYDYVHRIDQVETFRGVFERQIAYLKTGLKTLLLPDEGCTVVPDGDGLGVSIGVDSARFEELLREIHAYAFRTFAASEIRVADNVYWARFRVSPTVG